jgi:hypothetical protein
MLTSYLVRSVAFESFSPNGFPCALLYIRKCSNMDEANNLRSNIMARELMSEIGYSPLPQYYLEDLKYLGLRPTYTISKTLCEHGGFGPIYHQIYNDSLPQLKLLDCEQPIDLLSYKLGPEDEYLSEASPSQRVLLLSSVMLPTPVAQFYLEKVLASVNRRNLPQRMQQLS